jgi:hypothetical protein
VVSPLLGWSTFKKELLASPRYGLTTHFPGARMFETSPVELLAKGHVSGELEFVIVPETMPLAEVKERHEAGARAFAAQRDLEPVRITSVEALLDCQRALVARIAAKLRRRLDA